MVNKKGRRNTDKVLLFLLRLVFGCVDKYIVPCLSLSLKWQISTTTQNVLQMVSCQATFFHSFLR